MAAGLIGFIVVGGSFLFKAGRTLLKGKKFLKARKGLKTATQVAKVAKAGKQALKGKQVTKALKNGEQMFKAYQKNPTPALAKQIMRQYGGMIKTVGNSGIELTKKAKKAKNAAQVVTKVTKATKVAKQGSILGKVGKAGGLMLAPVAALGGVGSIFSGWLKFRVFNEGAGLAGKAQSYFGASFAKHSAEHPGIHFILFATMAIFIVSFFLMLIYKFFGLEMNKKVRSFVLISPIICVVGGLIYISFMNGLRSVDHFFSNYGNLQDKDSVEEAMLMQEDDHQKLFLEYKEEDKNYVFEMVGRNLPKAFYAHMCDNLSSEQLSERRYKEVRVKGNYDGEYKLNVTPLMWAAYNGNNEAVKAFLECNKIDQKAYYIFEERVPCSEQGKLNYGYYRNRKFRVKTTHTPFSMAADNNRVSTMQIIRAHAEKNGFPTEGVNAYMGYRMIYKEDCEFGAGGGVTSTLWDTFETVTDITDPISGAIASTMWGLGVES